MLDDFDLTIQPEELFDEELYPPEVLIEDEDEDEEEVEEEEYSIEVEDLEELITLHYLETLAEDFEELEDEEEEFPDDINWEYELETTYSLEEEDFSDIVVDFFDMLNED